MPTRGEVTQQHSHAVLLGRLALPGLAATSLMSLGSLGVGWVAPASGVADHPMIVALRESEVGSALTKVAVIVSVGWLLSIWLSAGPLMRGLDVAGARRVGALALLWSLPLLVAPVLFSRDVFSYIALSRLVPAGVDPYVEGTGGLPTYWLDGADPMWSETPAPYGPVWMQVSTALFHLTGAEPTSALLGFRLLAVAGIALLVVSVPLLASLAGMDPGHATWLAVLNPMVLLHFSAAAHNDALMVGLLVAGLTVAMTGRTTGAVLLITVAGLVKAPALLALPFVALMHAGPQASWWTRARSGATVAVLAGGTAAVLTGLSGLGTGWVVNLSAPAAVDTWLSPVTALGRTLGALAEALGLAASDDVLASVRAVGQVSAVVVVAWLLLTGRRRPPLSGLALAMVAVVALGPVVQPWYLLWALPLVAVTGPSHTETRWVVGMSLGLSVYTLANSAATTDSVVALGEGIAALLAVVIVVAILLGPARTRRLLLPSSREAATMPA